MSRVTCQLPVKLTAGRPYLENLSGNRKFSITQNKKPEGGWHLPALGMTNRIIAVLFVDHEFSPSVFSHGFFVIALNSRFFLAIADDGKALRLDTQGEEVLQG